MEPPRPFTGRRAAGDVHLLLELGQGAEDDGDAGKARVASHRLVERAAIDPRQDTSRMATPGGTGPGSSSTMKIVLLTT